MADTSTATVETLTAEVRVLMVGSRQITLSVARQLDTVSIFRLDVFGRIKLKEDWHWGQVIGRKNGDSQLVVANYCKMVLNARNYGDWRRRHCGSSYHQDQWNDDDRQIYWGLCMEAAISPLIVLAGLR